ncbi:MAG: electron transport complex subunit RsxD [Gammaproteobacteria bacterium]|nr:electron transport complex subunit RsxD [Gammaproteobacteria bacterium]MBU1656073.1 electron transport complex subunit RsxD [Gammaproteobacteria bacterium]MBU1960342.1 electron transport complex subunit RsxD [Gammaproteobacteria bacterium]
MEFLTLPSPHSERPNSVSRVMRQVLLALLPAIVALTYYFGWGVLINLILASVTALAAEAAVMRARGRPALPVLGDLSALVTAWLFAIATPPLLPWWITVLGMVFAIVLVKQLYGGLGYNPFNPAMAAYILLLISYPVEMTNWLPPRMLNEHLLSFGETLSAVFTGMLPAGLSWDALSGATPLDEMRTQLSMNRTISEIHQSPLWGDFGALGWEWVGNWLFLGGVWLIYKRAISWHIPVAMLGSLAAISMFFFTIDPATHPFPLFHLFSGGAMLGAFFIATDPVTAATTKPGQLIYGAAIGLIVFVIRTWGGYPDAVAFAVLLMNLAAPSIDHYSQPRVVGHGEGRDG